MIYLFGHNIADRLYLSGPNSPFYLSRSLETIKREEILRFIEDAKKTPKKL